MRANVYSSRPETARELILGLDEIVDVPHVHPEALATEIGRARLAWSQGQRELVDTLMRAYKLKQPKEVDGAISDAGPSGS